MKPWVIGVLAVMALLASCCVGVMVLGVFAGDDDTPGSTTATSEREGSCTSTVDQWNLELERWGVSGRRESVRVALPWALQLDDALRSGDPQLNVFNATLGQHYTVTESSNDNRYNPLLSGRATDRATGEQVFFFFVTASQEGVANPVAVLGPEAEVRAHFPDEAQVRSLRGLNQFPLDCAAVEGHWKSGFNSVGERYAAGTGKYLGTATAAAWSDLRLEGSTFTRERNAYVNGGYSKENDSGSWSHESWSLVLEPEGGVPTRYKAAFIAVPSGFLLWLQNEQYRGDSTEFQRLAD